MMQSTITQLREIQKERRQRKAEALDKAADIRKFNEDHGLTVWEPDDPANPSEPAIAVDGFVFSADEIDAHIERQDQLDQAQDYAWDNQ